MEVPFSGMIWFWRGPAPFHFVTVPLDQAAAIADAAPAVTCGWGMISVRVTVGTTSIATSRRPMWCR